MSGEPITELTVTIKFDKPFPGLQSAETAAEVFESQLIDELTGRDRTGPRVPTPWGWGTARVCGVIVKTGGEA